MGNIISVKSEIGQLKKVMVHRPGRELLNLTPTTLDRLLFDDIPYLKVAQEEHDAFAKIMEDNGCEVVYLEDLMARTLTENPSVRDEFIRDIIEEGGITSPEYKREVFSFFSNIKDDYQLVKKTMEGINHGEINIVRPGSLVDLVNKEKSMILDPMPNLYFTRDPFATVGNGVMVNRMYSKTRRRETIYGEYIFKYLEGYKGVNRFYNRGEKFYIEGGDVLILSHELIAIGISQRTSPEAIEKLCANLFYESNSEVTKVLAFNIPQTRAFMHLDTVFTQIDKNIFTMHPGILGYLEVYEITPSINGNEFNIERLWGDLETILARQLNLDEVDIIQCGGGDFTASEREQWNDGSNTLAIAPGKVIVYSRNDITNGILREKGIQVLEMPSSELSRGRGGPRCMSMPLIREEL